LALRVLLQSHIDLLLNDGCLINISLISDRSLLLLEFKVTLRLTVSQSASLSWNKAPVWGLRPNFYYCQLRVCWCGALSLTRERVCRLQLLLALARAVILWSEPLWTRDHILLSQIWDFLFRRLLRLAGSRWRYSTPPPHGYLSLSHTGYYLNSLPFITSTRPEQKSPPPRVPLLFFMKAVALKQCLNSQATVWFSKCYPLLRNVLCLATSYLATTCSLLFVVTRTWFPIRCSAMDPCSGSTIPIFSRHVTLCFIVSDEIKRWSFRVSS
jgi:hypothetical protein